jgi:MOSC domain-containing protein YiiM
MAQITAVCVLHQLLAEPSNPDGTTAIDKRSVSGSVEVGPLGLVGDDQSDKRHHGGEDQAVYLYADEDAHWWAAELGRDITPGLFGENLRTTGIDLSATLIGQRWRIGESGLVVEVTSPRDPCATFARRMGEPRWVRRFTQRRAPGAYVRVIQPGVVGAGDQVVALNEPDHDVTVADVMVPAAEGRAARLLAAEQSGRLQLTPRMRTSATKQSTR